MSLESKFLQSVRDHGLPQTLFAKVLRSLRRFVEFELCVMCMNSGKPYNFDIPAEMPVEAITCSKTFHSSLHQQIPKIDYEWAFSRGDQCIANLHNGVVVGYEFSTNLPTRVTDGIEIYFPEWCGYGYASFTAPAYRGQKLAKHRWPESRRQKTIKHGTPPREVFYISLANLAALKSDAADGVPSIRLGYSLWVRASGRYWCWNSRGANRNGIGFRKSAI